MNVQQPSQSQNPARKSIVRKAYKHVRCAQRMMLTPNFNYRYRAISYLRLCCNAVRQYRSQGIDLAPELDAKRPYLELLKDFYQHDAFWTTKCAYTAAGLLVSSDPYIDRVLLLLQRCIQRCYLEHAALEKPAKKPAEQQATGSAAVRSLV